MLSCRESYFLVNLDVVLYKYCSPLMIRKDLFYGNPQNSHPTVLALPSVISKRFKYERKVIPMLLLLHSPSHEQLFHSHAVGN